jgi:hypothetical protein
MLNAGTLLMLCVGASMAGGIPASPSGRTSSAPTSEASSSGSGTPAASTALSEEEVRARVSAYLGAIDRAIPPEVWKGLGPHAGPVLEAIYKDRKEASYRRARALGLLAIVAPERAVALAPAAAQDETEAYLVRLSAVRTTSDVLPEGQREAALERLMVSTKDVRVRAQAAGVLAERASGCARVHQQVARERPEDREFFHRALVRCP